ncbi:hypothetical protein K438DRAFT_1773060 [Mycena galopus ATCC 62051]|nr:hypothetical protein K438DRAFT_1773060 [Mycena galopus ATCC 62051]
MPPVTQRCYDDEDRQERRLATHLAERRQKTRAAMAALRARETPAEQEARLAKHRENQRKYREKFREQIAHRARRAAINRNAAAGKSTKLRPKSRHYWSDPELMTTDEEEDDSDSGCVAWAYDELDRVWVEIVSKAIENCGLNYTNRKITKSVADDDGGNCVVGLGQQLGWAVDGWIPPMPTAVGAP